MVGKPNMKPTPEEVELGLTDENIYRRKTWAERTDYTPTPDQVERGLREGLMLSSHTWVRRMDYTPTGEQVARGLLDIRMLGTSERWRLRLLVASPVTIISTKKSILSNTSVSDFKMGEFDGI